MFLRKYIFTFWFSFDITFKKAKVSAYLLASAAQEAPDVTGEFINTIEQDNL